MSEPTTDPTEGILNELMGEDSDGDAAAEEIALEAGETDKMAAEADDDAEPDPVLGDPRYVQMQEEVQRLDKHQKGLYEELRSSRLALKRLEEIEAKIEAATKQPEPEEEVPDPQYDPASYAAYEAKKTREKLDQVLSRDEKREQERGQESQVRALQEWMGATEKEYQARHPEYEAAEDHWAIVTTKNIEMLHPQATPEQVDQAVIAAEVALAVRAKQNDLTLPEMKVSAAKNWGWRPPTAAPAAEVDTVDEVDETLPPPTGPRTKRNDKVKTLEGLGVSGQARGGKISPKKRLAKMSQDEYDAFMDDLVSRLGSEEKALRYVEASG